MHVPNKVMLLAVGLFFSTLSVGQECGATNSASVEKIADYLQQVGDDPAASACVQAAFHHLAVLPADEAIPRLITYLAYKRPLNEGERHGFFMHGKAPDVLYPAVYELYLIGGPAEPALISFISGNKDGQGLETKNALYTLLLIHHGDVVAIVREIHKASVSATSEGARDRLQAAARDAVKWCDERARSDCENALK
jgi:hypothetical protein